MKRSVRLIAIVGIVAVMAVAIVVLQSREPEAEPAPTSSWLEDDPDRIALLDASRDEIRRIEIEAPSGPLVIERLEDGSFRPRYEYDVAWNSQSVNRIVGSAEYISSRRVIGEVDDLAAYGLEAPQARITVIDNDGEAGLIIGGMTPAQDAYYIMRPGDATVYSVFSTWISPFFTTLDQLRVRTLPTIAAETLRRVRLRTLDGRTIEAHRRALDAEDEEPQDPELALSGFVVTAPYERTYAVNTNWLEELAGQLPELRVGRFVDDNPTDLSRYGLNPPRAVIEVSDENGTLALRIGSETDGGRFAILEGGSSVFVLSGADPIVSVRPYSTISAFALILNLDLIDDFVVEGAGERYVGSIERTEVEGEEEPAETFFLNGTEIADEQFRKLYQWAIGLLFDAEGATRTTGAPEATITYNFVDGSAPRVVSFVPENQNFLAVVRDGRAEFLIARAKIDRMLRAFREAVAEF